MSDELNDYDVIMNGNETTVQMTAAEAKLRFPEAKPKRKTAPVEETSTTRAAPVPNKARDRN